MTSDLDIYRSANELIEQHGDAADIEAAIRIDELEFETGYGYLWFSEPPCYSQHPKKVRFGSLADVEASPP